MAFLKLLVKSLDLLSFELKTNSNLLVFLYPHSHDMKKYTIGIITLLLSVTALSAQEGMNLIITGNDTAPALTKRELRRQKVAKRNLHYNILGGPSYTPDFGAVLGGSALMTFRMNPSDTTQLRSVVPVAIAFLFNGGINLFSKPQLFFKGDRFRISESLLIRTRKIISTVWATVQIRIMFVATAPANTAQWYPVQSLVPFPLR